MVKDISKYGVPQGNYKLVLVVRNDLKMGKGKIAAQVLISINQAFMTEIIS